MQKQKGISFSFFYFTFENEKGIRFLFFVRKFENDDDPTATTRAVIVGLDTTN